MIFSKTLVNRFNNVGCNLNITRQIACLVFNPIMVDYSVAFVSCDVLGLRKNDGFDIKLWTSGSVVASTCGFSFWLFGTRTHLSVAWSAMARLVIFFSSRFPVAFGSPARCVC